MKLKEFGKFKKLEVDSVSAFRAYLNECWKKRYSLYDDRALYGEEVSYNEQQFLTFDGNLVKARNYVGFIGYEGETLTIYPKVFPMAVAAEDIDGFLMTNLLYWLKRSTRVRFPIVDTRIAFNNRDSFLEILIYIFSKFTMEAVYNNPYNMGKTAVTV